MENEIKETAITVIGDGGQEIQVSTPFVNLYNQALEWKTKADALVITSADQTDEMKEARAARLALVKVRTGIEKKRKELNEDAKKSIENINSLAKFLTNLVTPIESHLLEQEEFAERELQKQKDIIKAERAEKLKEFNVDGTFFDLANMPDETFDILLTNSRLAHQQRIENDAKIKAEAELLARTNERINRLAAIGFTYNSMDDYTHPSGMNMTLEEIKTISDDVFNNSFKDISDEIARINDEKEKAAQVEAARLKAENDKLAAEKAELERAETQRKAKHNTAIERQQKLVSILVNMEYDQVANFSDDEFDVLFSEKKKAYDAEQQRLFVEKKKAEFEAAQKVKREAEEAAEKRARELAPEKHKLKYWIDDCKLYSIEDYKEIENVTPEAKKIADEIFTKFTNFKKWAADQIETLK